MSAETKQTQDGEARIRLLVNQNDIRANVTITTSLPIVLQRVISQRGIKRSVSGKQIDDIRDIIKQLGIVPKAFFSVALAQAT